MKLCLFSKYPQSGNLLYFGVREALNQLKIKYLDLNISLIKKQPSPHWISIPTLNRSENDEIDSKILKKIEKFKPEIIIFLQYSGLPFLANNGPILKKIIGKKGKIVFWLVDLAEKIYPNQYLGQFIDYFFLTNAGQIKEYQKKWGVKNIFFMPQGCFLARSLPKLNKKIYNLGFLGRRQRDDKRYEARNKILDAFKKKFGLEESDKELSLNQQIDFYQKCKIVIGSSWRNDVYLYSSDRIFNVLGAGSFYLCSYFPGIEKLFENKKHLVWFKNINEGINLAKYYLKANEEREKIAYNGYLLVKEKHTYVKRIKNILEILNYKNFDFDGFLS